MIGMLAVATALSAAPQIDKAFETAVERQKVPGAVIGVVVDGKLAYLKTHGVRDVAANAPVTPETRFRIASMTKSFTAAGILQLRDAGKLSLDDPAAKYVPQLAKIAYPTKDSPPITIRHLLTHAEGFPEDNAWGDRQLAQTNEVMDAWMRAGIPFSNAPGVAYEYSNYGFAILGRIIERVSGQPYDVYITEKILKPLGMTVTTFRLEDVPKEHIAYGYRLDGDKAVLQPPLAHGSFGAMGGLWTTAGDLAKWVAFMLSAFPPRDDPDNGPVRRASVREMQQFSRFANASVVRTAMDAPLQMTASAYGYGLRISRDCRFDHIVGHGGGLPGYGSYMQWLPDYGVGVITMSNLIYNGMNGVNNEAFTFLAPRKRLPQPSTALLSLKKDLTSLVLNGWDQALADRIMADNVFMDVSADVRKTRLADALAKVGTCRDDGAFNVENGLRGEWRMTCDRGFLLVGLTVAPTMPPRVQAFITRPIVSPSADDLKRVEPMLAATAHPMYGNCTIGDPFDTGIVTLNCERGTLRARLTLEKVELLPARDKPCVP